MKIFQAKYFSNLLKLVKKKQKQKNKKEITLKFWKQASENEDCNSLNNMDLSMTMESRKELSINHSNIIVTTLNPVSFPN